MGRVEDPRTGAIIGAALEVHLTLGCGFLERVYQLALASEFRRRGIPFEAEVGLPVHYKDEVLASEYRLDFPCFGAVPVETKAIGTIGRIEVAQLLNYLKAGSFPMGLLLNFGTTDLEIRRLGMTPELRRATWLKAGSERTLQPHSPSSPCSPDGPAS